MNEYIDTAEKVSRLSVTALLALLLVLVIYAAWKFIPKILEDQKQTVEKLVGAFTSQLKEEREAGSKSLQDMNNEWRASRIETRNDFKELAADIKDLTKEIMLSRQK